MRTFNIEISNRTCCNFVVKADSKEEAERLAKENLSFVDPDYFKESEWTISSSIEMTNEDAIERAKNETSGQGRYFEAEVKDPS